MADDLTLPATGGVVATDEVSSRHYQLFKPAFGADGSATLVAADAGMPTQSGYKEFSGSASANNTDLVTQDISGYRWVSVQLTGTFSATVVFQSSNDNSNWVACSLADPSGSTSPSTTRTSTGMAYGPVPGRYFRVRTAAYTSGTPAVVVGFHATPSTLPFIFPTTANFSVIGSATPSDGNGFSSNSLLTYSAMATYNGSNWDRARSLGVTGIVGVTPTPGTTGGWSVSSTTALSTTKVAVKASAGTFGGYMIFNPNTVETHVQVFNVASGSVTLGSTTPTYVLTIPANSAANLELTCGINHSTAITIAATTTATGSSAPTTGLQATIFYK